MHIDRLVLQGFRHEDQHSFAEGLRGELGRQLADPAALRHLMSQGHLSRLDVGGVRIGSESTTRDIGMHAARAIARGMGHERG